MNRHERKNTTLAVSATVVVLLNLAIAHAHGLSHARFEVPLEPWQIAFVQAVVFVAPLVAAVLFWTRLRRAAAALLGSAMLAGMVFGVDFQFVADMPDHMCYRTSHGGGTLFVVTAALLVPAGAIGAAFGAWSWRRLGRTA